MTENLLAGGVAVITGAAQGLGQGIARAAAHSGMRLVLADIAVDPLSAFAAELERAGVEVLAQPTDVSDPTALDRLADATFDRFGSVRLLVNNAGVEVLGNLWELSSVQMSRIINVNLLGQISGVRAFAKRMIAARQPAYIANVASIGALAMLPLQSAYIISKHAVLSFSEGLFLEMQRAAPFIQVSVILPGAIDTQIFATASSTAGQAADHHRQAMQSMLATHGMAPDEAGRLILDQISQGRFWVSNDPNTTAQAASERADYLAKLAIPALPPRLEAFY